MVDDLLIQIPVYPLHCDLVVCPLPAGETKKVLHILIVYK